MPVPGATVFNGNDANYLTLASPSVLGTTFSTSLFFCRDVLNATFQTFVHYAAAQASGYQFELSTDSDSKTIRLFVEAGARALGGLVSEIGQWCFAGITSDGVTTRLHLKVLGGRMVVSAGAAPASFTPGWLSIGRDGDTTVPFNGRLYGMRWWKGVILTPAAMEAESRSLTPVQLTGLIGDWRFEQPSRLRNLYGTKSFTNNGTLTFGRGPLILRAPTVWSARQLQRIKSVRAGTSFTAPLNETAAVSESMTGKFAGKAGPAETAAVSESVAGKQAALAPVSESTITVSDAAVAKFNAKPTLPETVTVSDTLALHWVAHVPLSEGTINVSELVSTGGATAFTAPLFETAPASESVAGKLGARTTLPETAAVVDAVAAKIATHLTLPETAALANALNVVSTTRAQLSETVPVADNALLARYATKAQLDENVPMQETSVGSKGFHVGLAENAALAEAVIGRLRAHPTLLETIGVLESIVLRFVTHVTLTESAPVSDAATAKLGAKAGLAETAAVLDAVVGRFRAKAALGEAIVVGETISTGGSAAYTVALVETIVVLESASQLLRRKAPLAETAAVSDAAAAKQGLHVGLAEASTVLDALVVHHSAAAALVETAPVSEAAAARQGLHAPVAETAALANALALIFHARANLAETSPLNEAITAGNTAYSIALFESAPLLEALVAGAHSASHLSETAALAENLAAHHGARAALSETIILLEAISTSGQILYVLRKRLHGVVLDGTGATAERARQKIIWPLEQDGRLELAMVSQDGSPYLVAGATIRMGIGHPGSGALLLHVTGTATGASSVSFALSRAALADAGLSPNFDYIYDVQLTDADGKRAQVVPASTFRPSYFRP